MNVSLESIIDKLRGAGEPTRMRILSLLRIRDLSVGELVQVLGQSQPRLSHHLKALTTAGLVERLPEGSFVFYRAAAQSGPAQQFLEGLFDQIDPDEPTLKRDTERLAEVSAARAATAETYFASIAETWDTIRALHYPNDQIESTLLELAGAGPFKKIVDFGTGTGRMLSIFGPHAKSAEGIDLSHHMLTVARSNLEKVGLDSVRVRQGDVMATPFKNESADLVIIHQVLHYVDAPNRVISEAGRILLPGGRLLVVDFAPHNLEFLRAEHGHHRLGLSHEALTVWARDAGLMLEAPVSFDPPEQAGEGLTVNIWRASKISDAERRVA